jgi:isoleucyl-tRNA synthetase
VTDAAGIEPVVPVGADGRFLYPVTDYEGMLVFDANLPIIDHLRARTRGEGDPGAVTEARCCSAARATTMPTRTAGGAANR